MAAVGGGGGGAGGGRGDMMGEDEHTGEGDWGDDQGSSAHVVGEDGRHRKDHQAHVPQEVYERVMEVSGLGKQHPENHYGMIRFVRVLHGVANECDGFEENSLSLVCV